MGSEAHTPEELETLLEDAFVTRDRGALARLFEDGAVLVGREEPAEVRGGARIARCGERMWTVDRTYVADPRRVLQAGDTALVVVRDGVNVARRGSDRAWRYAIAFLSLDIPTMKEER